MKRQRRIQLFAGALICLLGGAVLGQAAPADTGWMEIHYDDLIDGRKLTHSGEPLAAVLRRLEGRAFPFDGGRAGDRQAHQLIEPLLEPFGFVLIDTLDTLENPRTQPPRVELGSLWLPGEAQPAWVALLRSRRLIVESDGSGRLRLILPYEGSTQVDEEGFPLILDSSAGEAAWLNAYPVLRHVLRAELRRLEATPESPGVLELAVHGYIHRPERTSFLLGKRPRRLTVDAAQLAQAPAPALDLTALKALFSARKSLAGARLQEDGEIEWWTAEGEAPTGLLNRSLTVADLAVAWRAVAHGGRAEPYMSLDRAPSPWLSKVSYGGRLRDTRLGWVSLLCDVRFKTFSNGLGFFEGRDLREETRRSLPGFATHMEKLAWDPRAARLTGQQTRLWFYPDTVDLTVSPQLDVLGLRSVRMSAASEKISLAEADPTAFETPPWTRNTIDRINSSYDELAAQFPEMQDLDQVVRLLSVATWLQAARAAGRTIPDLDALLDVTLPSTPTPRRFPQQLAFHALPPAGKTTGEVWALDRLPLAQAWARTDPLWGERPDAVRSWLREREALDPADGAQAAWLTAARDIDPQRTSAVELDLMTYRARRLRMHQAVLQSLDGEERERLIERRNNEGVPRLFSLGIGGIDLGLGRSLRRALGAAGQSSLSLTSTPARSMVSSTKRKVRGGKASIASPLRATEPGSVIPAYADGTGSPRHSVTRRKMILKSTNPAATLERYHPDALDGRVRVLLYDEGGRVAGFSRREGDQRLSYRLVGDGKRWRARPGAPPALEVAPSGKPAGVLPDTFAALTLRETENEAGSNTFWIDLRRGEQPVRSAEMPVRVLQGLLLGPQALPEAQRRLPGWDPPPREIAEAGVVIVWGSPEDQPPDWQPAARRFGEAVPARLARGLGRILEPPVVLGVEGERSLERLTQTRKVPRTVSLVLPRDAFPFPHEALRDRLAATWTAGPVLDSIPAVVNDALLIVGAESGNRFGERIAAARAGRKGASLLAWNLTETPRTDRRSQWLRDGGWNGLALAEGSVLEVREAELHLAELSRSIRQSRGEPWFAVHGPFLWSY